MVMLKKCTDLLNKKWVRKMARGRVKVKERRNKVLFDI